MTIEIAMRVCGFLFWYILASWVAMAAVAIGFSNDPAILNSVVAINLLQIVVGVFAASYWAIGRPAPDDTPVEVKLNRPNPCL
jgi:hypothetical protein